jgi:hypothetical protein
MKKELKPCGYSEEDDGSCSMPRGEYCDYYLNGDCSYSEEVE